MAGAQFSQLAHTRQASDDGVTSELRPSRRSSRAEGPCACRNAARPAAPAAATAAASCPSVSGTGGGLRPAKGRNFSMRTQICNQRSTVLMPAKTLGQCEPGLQHYSTPVVARNPSGKAAYRHYPDVPEQPPASFSRHGLESCELQGSSLHDRRQTTLAAIAALGGRVTRPLHGRSCAHLLAARMGERGGCGGAGGQTRLRCRRRLPGLQPCRHAAPSPLCGGPAGRSRPTTEAACAEEPRGAEQTASRLRWTVSYA